MYREQPEKSMCYVIFIRVVTGPAGPVDKVEPAGSYRFLSV